MEDKPKYDPLRKINTVEQYIKLECPRSKCRYSPDGLGLMVPKYKYMPGAYKCEKCKTELIIK